MTQFSSRWCTHVLLVGAMVVGGCGGSSPSDDDDDDGYAIGGSVTGLWDGDVLQLRLEHGDAFAIASITADGAFQFAEPILDGESFVVTVANGLRCDVENGQGVVAGASVDNISVRCTAAVDVLLSAPIPFTFDPIAPRTDVDLSILTQRLGVTVVAPGMTIELDGAAASSGVPVTISVAPGEQTVVIDLTDGARHRRYDLVLHRGARPLEYAGLLAAEVMQVNPAELGASLAMSDDELLAGAPWYDSDFADEGGMRAFTRDGSTWSAAGTWRGSDTSHPYADFGNAIARDGDLLAVGAYMEGDRFLNQGAVYVFRRTLTGWTQLARLVAPEPGFNDYFGGSVAIKGDTIAVGAVGEDSDALGLDGNPMNDAAPESGAVYIFRQTSPDVWTLTSYIKANTVANRFGSSVALDGELLAVGASGSNAAYVFRRSGASWVQDVRIASPVTLTSPSFGFAVALSGDRIAIASYADSGAGSGINGSMSQTGRTGGGAVHVFLSTATGWMQEAYIKAAAPTDNANFGVGLSFVGDVLAVGANGDSSSIGGINPATTSTSALRSGAAFVFHRVGTTWSQDAYIKAMIPIQLAELGRAVALSMTGLAIGAPREPGGGAAHVIR